MSLPKRTPFERLISGHGFRRPMRKAPIERAQPIDAVLHLSDASGIDLPQPDGSVVITQVLIEGGDVVTVIVPHNMALFIPAELERNEDRLNAKGHLEDGIFTLASFAITGFTEAA